MTIERGAGVRTLRQTVRSPTPYLVGAAALLIGVHLTRPEGVFAEVVYLAALLGAAAVAVWGSLRRPRGTRAPWGWIAAGICSSGLGDLTYSLQAHLRGYASDISLADVFWLASYVAISVGLVMLVRLAEHGRGRDIDGIIDMAIVGVVSLLVVWQIAVQATVTDTSTPVAVRVVWASYPILDAALLALVVGTVVVRSSSRLIAMGVACWLFSDLFYMLFPDSAAWALWQEAGWMVGAALLAAATWPRGSVREMPRGQATTGPLRVALILAPLLVPGAIEVIGFTRGYDPDPVPLFIASLVIMALVFVRVLRVIQTAKNAQAELRAQGQHFEALVQRSSDAALVLDRDATIRYVSPAATDQFGFAPDDLIGRSGWSMIHPDDVPRAVEGFSQIDDSPGAHATVELRIRDASGQWRWVEEVVTNLLDEKSVAGLVANVRDISTRKAAESELARMAHYDRLTGLPNRWLLISQLNDAIASQEDGLALLIMDLDQFKFVNDSRGHGAGDQLLQAVAERLSTALRPGDTLARNGGDEFAVICRDVRGREDARTRAHDLQQALGAQFAMAGIGTFFITGGVGIALAQRDETSERLVQRADTAMYAAKRHGANQSAIFDENLRNRAEDQLTVQTEIRAALKAHEFTVHYQPVIELATGAMDGVEALVRWRHPTRGLVMPGEFIPVAEKSELIDGIGAFVLEQACADASWWARAGHPLSVAVNISATQLRRDDLASTIQTTLYNSGLAAELLIIEITETALLLGADRVMQNVQALRAMGVRVALDDFGTGYSSLSYLKKVPADIVKIDRAFIADINENPIDRGITAAIIELAHVLGRTVIAEGIETEAQRTELHQLGCPLAQGYLWSRAVPAEQILQLRTAFLHHGAGLRIAPDTVA